MDSSPTGILAIIGVVISVGSVIIGTINHQRIRSNCFGRKLEVSLDIEKTTPPAPADSQAQPQGLKISVPQEQP